MKPNIAAIIETVRIVTGGTGDADPLISIADRESRFVHQAIGDVAIAAGVFDRDKQKIKDRGSPWTEQPELWAGSFGLFQLMAPYEVQKWAVAAKPNVLFHPVISTITAMRKWNRCIDLGAKTPVDVRMVWAYGGSGLKIPKDDNRYTERVTSERDRWKKLGLAGDPATIPAKRFAGAGVGPQTGQNELAELISKRLGLRADVIPPANWTVSPATTDETETETETKTETATAETSRAMTIALVAAIAVGGFYLWQTTKKSSRIAPLAPSS